MQGSRLCSFYPTANNLVSAGEGMGWDLEGSQCVGKHELQALQSRAEAQT